ncbi:hypothetical protein BN59_02472 [Legionella massiliensis]|uniref:ATPase involved in DNA repair n=1 Tax=Legionella massiliensis TaxID=1034943 RepID=A0A078L264_9GAMM|nr:hypothetical protein [Legionella massiliensis]CDZ78164.1 hypothetical protein BN59_02472 [Legionella massiliensis]CEE13902.1 hypothetical protein BN1094_02472 [Legionella massiliensis]
MIEVNIWLPTAHLFSKRITHGILGPILASEDRGENVGHVNFVLTLDERSASYEYIEQEPHGLMVEKSLAILPETVVRENNRFFKQKFVKSFQVTHSFWPKEKPSNTALLRDFLSMLHLGSGGRGVSPEFSEHRSDMKREDTGEKSAHIQHDKEALLSLCQKKQRNLALAVDASDLECDLENKKTWEVNLEQLSQEKDNLEIEGIRRKELFITRVDELKKADFSLENNLNELDKKLNFYHRKLSYLEKISHPDNKTEIEIKAIKDTLNDLYEKQENIRLQRDKLTQYLELLQLADQQELSSYKNKINQIEIALAYYQRNLKEANERINGRDENDLQLIKGRYKEKVDLTLRREHFLKKSLETEGRHPDHSLSLPTSESGLAFYVDEAAVLKAMREENLRAYSLLLNNCVKSVKRCLLNGISHIKVDLRNNGVAESFFKLEKVETCKGFRTWARQLDRELANLNYQLKEAENPIAVALA